jgi:hypothetical protein
MNRILHTLTFLVLLLSPQTKAIAEEYQITADYAVFASGFRTLAAQANIREGQDDYGTYVTIKTDGLLKSFAPWSGILTSIGTFAPETGQRRPELHAFDNIWRGTNKRVEQRYDEKGALKNVVIKEDKRADEIKVADPALTDNATDILSAALEISRVIKDTDSCTSKQAVYDGKRRFIMEFDEQKRDNFKASKYNSYSGEAIKCIIKITPDGGKWRDKKRGWMSIQEQSIEKGHPPYIWFGKVTATNKDETKSAAWIPVKLQVKTSYGTLMLHLKNANMRETNQIVANE